MKKLEVSPRIITVGDSGVGKTSLIYRIKNGSFLEHTCSTIGAGVTPIDVSFRDKVLSFQLWDTAGQEMYRNIIPIYFKGAFFAILVFSMSDSKSFQSLENWMSQIYEHADQTISIVIVGNKCDMQNPQVSEEEAKRWARQKQIEVFFVSAKSGINIRLIMEHVAEVFLSKQEDVIPTSKSVDPTFPDHPNRNCC